MSLVCCLVLVLVPGASGNLAVTQSGGRASAYSPSGGGALLSTDPINHEHTPGSATASQELPSRA